MPRPHNRPDRALVIATIKEAAEIASVSLSELLTSSTRKAVAARRYVLRRVKDETGCSTYGLAAVFGCDHGAVLDAIKTPEPPEPTRQPSPAGFRFSLCPDHDLSAALTCFAAIDRMRGR